LIDLGNPGIIINIPDVYYNMQTYRKQHQLVVRNSGRLAKQNDNMYRLHVHTLLKMVGIFGSDTIRYKQPKDRVVVIKQIYDYINGRVIPFLVKVYYTRPRLWRFLEVLYRRIDMFKLDIEKHDIPEKLRRTFKKSMDKYKKWNEYYKYDSYYKIWVIRNALPYDIYRLVGKYYFECPKLPRL
jgi:hypothetical protein